jgi:hypothetical protein
MIINFTPRANRKSQQVDFATALRCIGQDLQLRGLKTFDISFDGRDYLAQCGYQEAPAATPVTLKYTVADLEALNQSGAKRRGDSVATIDFLNIVQLFRTVGGYLDKNEAQLVRFTNNHSNRKDSQLRVEYMGRDGTRVVEDRPGSALYDMCVAMYKQRGKRDGTHGKLPGRRR